MTRRGTSGLVHGRPGAGKSTLLHTMPGPRLIADAEAGDDEFDDDIEVMSWDDWIEDEDPSRLTRRTSVIYDVNDYGDYRDATDYIIRDRKRVFRSYGIDSLTRVQEMMEDELLPINRTRISARHRNYDHFGALLDYMKDDLDRLHALTKSRGLITWWACQSDRETEPIVPQLAGALRKKVSRIPDIIGFLRVEEGLNDEGDPDIWRILDISSAEGALAETKCRRRRVNLEWGSEIPDPNLTEIASVASPRKAK